MRLKAAQVALAVTALAWAACSSKTPIEVPTGGSQEEVRIWFTALDVPASIAADETLIMRLSGSAGPDLCYAFRRIEHIRESSTIELVGFGVRWFCIPCPAQVSTFEGVEHRVDAPFVPGPLHLVARQPDGSYVERVVNVLPTP